MFSFNYEALFRINISVFMILNWLIYWAAQFRILNATFFTEHYEDKRKQFQYNWFNFFVDLIIIWMKYLCTYQALMQIWQKGRRLGFHPFEKISMTFWNSLWFSPGFWYFNWVNTLYVSETYVWWRSVSKEIEFSTKTSWTFHTFSNVELAETK